MRRREAAAYAAALFSLAPGRLRAAGQLPDRKLFDRDSNRYWKRIREEQFLLPGWRAFLNNGSLGIAPLPVVEAVADYLRRSAALTTDGYPRWGYETLDEHREEMSRFLGCKKDELALMHNATEAMCTIAGGLDLKQGEEVLLTNQEHPSGRGCWYQKAKRYGVSVREVPIPLPPKNPEQIADLMISAMGPRTRVLSFSGITTHTGLIMPVRTICDAARAKGVLTVVDGAHVHGQVPMPLSETGCDFFAGSPHKWMFAPAGCGILYVREEMLHRLWANTMTGNWDDLKLKAARFMMIGTNNRAVFEGMMAGLRFLQTIGPERIYARTHELARGVFERARKLPYVKMLTPDDDRMFGALVTFGLEGDIKKLHAACRKKRIWIQEGPQLRVSTHIHTRPEDVDTLFETMAEVYG
jgi:selenocysteine lyase/cysteine desulfurase